MKKYNLALIGATGAVGQQLIKWLSIKKFPFNHIELYASKKSEGKVLNYKNNIYTIKKIEDISFDNIDICFFCADNSVSKKYITQALKNNCIVIDNSSLYRLKDDVPLLIPHINKSSYQNQKLISNPNCATNILCSAIYPINNLFSINKIVVSTYQSVSGIGIKALEDFKIQTKLGIDNISYKSDFFPVFSEKNKYQMAFNCIPQIGMFENDYTTEELKIINETQKILNKKINIIATCVRTPTLKCHCECVYVECDNKIDLNNILNEYKKDKYIKVMDSFLPINSNCSDREEIFISRIRQIDDYSICLYVVGDNLLKGSATNAIDIASFVIGGNN